MMKSIKEECLHYSLVCGLKSDLKDAEVENENMKEELRKLQENCMVLNSRVVSMNWKIQQATFILGYERKKRNLFYDIMETAKSKYDTKSEIPQMQEKETPNLFV